MTRPRDLTVSYLVGRVDRILKAELEEALADSGLSLPEYTALSVLSTRPGLSNARLARRSLVTPQAMHKVMRSLESQGLVSRTAPANDGRSLEAEITDAGRGILAGLADRIRRAEDQVFSGLDAGERRELLRLLGIVSGLR